MKYQRASSLSLSLSLKPLLGIITVLFLFAFSLVMIALHQRSHSMIGQFRYSITSVIAPVMETLSAPANAVDGGLGWFAGLLNAYEENKRLRAENLALHQWQTVAEHLQAENTQLKQLLDIRKSTPTKTITARAISVPEYAFSHTVLINQGSGAGISSGQAVMAPQGLVGRVLDTTAQNAHVMLLSDINARIPVMTTTGGEKAILAGTNGPTAELKYVGPEAKLKVGDRLVTAGDGNVIASGLPVGEIAAVEGETYRVRFFAKPSQVDYLQVLAR